MQKKDGKMFTAEARQQITRFANLGMLGHQAAIAGHCKETNLERRTIANVILKQKVGDAAPPLPPGAGGEFAPWNSSQAWQRYGSKRPSKSAANQER